MEREAIDRAAKNRFGRPGIIDIHHHLVPPGYFAARGVVAPGQIADWTPARAIEDMDRDGVAAGITSIAAQGVWTGNAETSRGLARLCNDYAAKLAADHPGRFGIFAALPLPDADGSLAEIAYALETLGADGFALLSSYDGKYLGDKAFAPVLAELDRRAAVVYVHPTVPPSCRSLVTVTSPPMLEFQIDTTRAIASLMFGGTAARLPDIRFIFAHGGGVLPSMIERFRRWPADEPPNPRGQNLPRENVLPRGADHEIRKFYYDTAFVTDPVALAGLMKMVPPSQLLFGTDYPYRDIADQLAALRGNSLTGADLRAIERGNAERLLSRSQDRTN